jgi:iron complex transport system substrate-binding protein
MRKCFLWLFTFLAGCGLLLPGTPALADPSIRLFDDAGHAVVLDAPARRIVSLAPYLTELLYAAGAGDAIVGTSEFSDYPQAARDIPRIGGGAGLDIESIIALQPDLVVAWQSGNPEGQLERLQALGTTLFLSEPRQLLDVPGTLVRLGKLAGSEQAAQAAVRSFEVRHRKLQQRYSGRPTVDVFYQVWRQPLMTVNGEHLISDVIRLCGGRNVFSDLPVLAPQIDIEAVLAADPAVIIVGTGGTSETAELQEWTRWPMLAAVARGHVYGVQRELLVRHSPRILDGAEQVCGILEKVRGEKSEKSEVKREE